MTETYTTHEDLIQEEPTPEGDVDTSGQLALGLFIGVIVLLLVFIYAFASAA